MAASMRCFMSSAEGMATSVEDRARPTGPAPAAGWSPLPEPRSTTAHLAILWKALEPSHMSQAVITISDKGAEKVHEFLAGQEADVGVAGLRVGVRGGGCSGFQYQLAFDEQRDGDLVFEG